MENQPLNTSHNDDEICLCEVDGRLYSTNKNRICDVSKFTRTVEKNPSITISRDVLHTSSGVHEMNRNVFLPVQEPIFKRFIQVWYEQGIVEALHVVSDVEEDTPPSLSVQIAQYFLKIVDRMNQMRPSLLDFGPKLVSSLATTNEWGTSPIRCIAWHPYLTKLAVALLDDTIRIYSSDTNLVPVLKLRRQKSITCMTWRPMTHSELAVGCEQAIILWIVDPNSVVNRPSSNNAHVINTNGHTPIMSLTWSPFGDLLASAAARDTSIHIWDVDTNRSERICRSAGGGKNIVTWSPDGLRLFTSSLGIIFRIWNCTNWTAERWDVGEGRVQSACFSPCGTVLLFCTTNEPVIYALRSNSEGIWATTNENMNQQAMAVLNLSKNEDKSNFQGGLVRNLCWSPNGNHLAVLFKDSKSVAIFNTITHPVLKITLCCYANGLEYETPCAIAFQQNFSHGSCLTIAWTSGRVQYFPLVTTQSTVKSNITYQEHLDSTIHNASFPIY